MIISNNRNPKLTQFRLLLDNATDWLNNDAKKRVVYYTDRNAQKLEDDVKTALDTVAVDTPFAGSIEKISGQRFPDIVAAKYYGVEVKSSKDEHWCTLGGSVNESTRVADVERIFLTFGKLTDPIEFCSRPYEDCLSDVVVTHYPRYKIDMRLDPSKSIFAKMNTTYDELRLSEDPVGIIVDYYRGQLADGESLWWTGKFIQEEQATTAPMKIRMWRTLTADEKIERMIDGFALFPNVLSSSSIKYERFSLWLAATHGILSTSMRDTFSAGGQATIYTQHGMFEKAPQALYKISRHNTQIAFVILKADDNLLKETWRTNKIYEDRIGQWIDIVSNYYHIKNHSVHQILNAIFNRKCVNL